MPNYTITDTPLQLSGLYSAPYQIRNGGENAIYLSKDSSVSAQHYDWILNAGDTLGFSAETDLWLVCAATETATIQQQYGALGNFTPAPSTVYARTKNALTVLDEETLVVPSAATVIPAFGALRTLNVEDYASILITVDCQSTSHAGFTPIIDNNIQGSFCFGDSNPVTTIQNNWITPQWLLVDAIPTIDTGYQASYVQLPVSGKYLTTQFVFVKKVTADSGTLKTTILGSNQSIDKPQYLSCGYGLTDELIRFGQFYSTHTGSSFTTNIATRNVPVTLSSFRANNATSHSVWLQAWIDGLIKPVYVLRENLSEYSGNGNLQLPMAPIFFRSDQSGTLSTVQAMIVS